MKRCLTDVLRSIVTAACNGSFWERIWGFLLLVKVGSFPKGPIAKGPGMVLGYIFMVSKLNFSDLEQSWLDDIVSRGRFARVVRTMGLIWESSP